jgi:hypothetical protein
MPGVAGSQPAGCLLRATDQDSYCGEDGDPCTIDACSDGACRHEADGSGPRCPQLINPYRVAVALLASARALETALQAAPTSACPQAPARTPCDLAAGDDTMRMVALLESARLDLETSALALAGRLAGSSSPSTPRDPEVRARLALGLLADTPGELRGFLATLAQARARREIAPAFARARRSEGVRLLRGVRKLRAHLRRIVARRQSFAR